VGIADGVPANYHPPTGEVQATGGIPIPNACFRSIAILLPDEVAVAFGVGGEWEYGAIVELHPGA
jgi:hypothetical protein